MVYHGPSKGCNSCKKRRKKCDQTKPSCLRCLKANRTCAGYEFSLSNPAFKQYKASSPPDQLADFCTTARKCSMPMRVPIPGTDILPEDVEPADFTPTERDSFALRSFFYDWCLRPTNPQLSRGYLADLEPMALQLGPKSDLAKACRAVGFAAHGQPLNRPILVQLAGSLYHELLGALAKAIAYPDGTHAKETKYVAMLLGMYQISVTTSMNQGDHDTHARGLAALSRMGPSPLNLLSKTTGVFNVPSLKGPQGSLDQLIIDLSRVRVDSDNMVHLQEECVALNQRFITWETSRQAELRPTKMASIRKSKHDTDIRAGCWPGPVDTYFDFYVAGVWNIFRSARLLLLLLLIQSAQDYEGTDEHIKAADCLVDEMIASIPYHLVENLYTFLDEQPTGKGMRQPGKLLGGLLLMHPIYVASEISFIDEQKRQYLKTCLLWIGDKMGIGQASFLAKTPNVNWDYLASGCMIIWSGFL